MSLGGNLFISHYTIQRKLLVRSHCGVPALLFFFLLLPSSFPPKQHTLLDCFAFIYFIMSFAGPSRGSLTPDIPRPSNVKYVSAAALNLERVYEQNRARLQQRDGALSPTSEQVTAIAGKGKPRLLLMGQRRYTFLEYDWRTSGCMLMN